MKIFKPAACFALLAVFSVSVFGQKMKPEDVLAKHLESIGTAEKRASLKSIVAVGDVSVKFISQKNQTAEGRVVIASMGEKYFLGMNLNAADYPLEKFSFDGRKARVAYVRANIRSVLGEFMLSNNLLIEETLLGGTLSTSWALLNIANNKAKLSLDGTKKIDGKEVYVLGYSPKGGGDVDINLYFDKETFRHVRTEYKRIASASQNRGLGGGGVERAQTELQNETRLKVVEDFSDFKTENGITLPHSYRLNYTINGQNGLTEIEWKSTFTQFSFNQNLDPRTFDPDTEL
jgi:hypothetical protein